MSLLLRAMVGRWALFGFRVEGWRWDSEQPPELVGQWAFLLRHAFLCLCFALLVMGLVALHFSTETSHVLAIAYALPALIWFLGWVHWHAAGRSNSLALRGLWTTAHAFVIASPILALAMFASVRPVPTIIAAVLGLLFVSLPVAAWMTQAVAHRRSESSSPP